MQRRNRVKPEKAVDNPASDALPAADMTDYMDWWRKFAPGRAVGVRRFGATEGSGLEVRAGIEPASADLQSDASPLCHRTPEASLGAKNRRNLRVTAPRGVRISEFPELS